MNAETSIPSRSGKRASSFSTYSPAVKLWLITGLFMIFMQVVIGGVTRLTGSGLSITRWEIVTGSLPPLSAAQWEEAFDLYKQTPQYQKINQGMSMPEFKFIFFWEYFHRLWARLMGFVFIIPFAIFYFRGKFDRPLLTRLGIVFLLAVLVASFGWIMVASGLINRPWVNAYKLTMHLSLALLLFGYLFWTTLRVVQPRPVVFHNPMLKKGVAILLVVTALQIVLGGIMSGMKAGLYFPTWPDMNGEFLPPVLFDQQSWSVENFVEYERSLLAPALVQALHRTTAYLLVIIGLWLAFGTFRQLSSKAFQVGIIMLITMLVIQAVLGILTVVNSIGVIPVGLGVLHQAGALLLLCIVLFLFYQSKASAFSKNVENFVENI